MLKIAITGNIASGKSQVEKFIRELGYTVYDADKIAHGVLDSITYFYGYDVFTDGKIDRKKLGNIVFSDTNLRNKLEKMTHPLIKLKILELFEQNTDKNYVFVSVPLLYEAEFDNIFDLVLIITVNESTQLSRLMARNNLTVQEALLRMHTQMPQKEKIKKADYIINNNSSLDNLKNSVYKFIGELKNKC